MVEAVLILCKTRRAAVSTVIVVVLFITNPAIAR